MPVSYTNRKGLTYTLYRGQTKTGKPRYYFGRAGQGQGEPVAELPVGFTISEGVNGVVSLVKDHPSLIRGVAKSPLCELGWKSLGALELTALPSIKEDHWVPLVQEADALLVGGGDPFYLCYWMRQSGLADLLPELGRETVYVGVSGGSMVVTAISREQYDMWGQNPPTGSDRALGLVDFTLYAHLDHPDMPDASLANIEKWAAGIPVPAYAIDDQTAIKVIDGAVEVVSEGHWKRFTP